MEFSIVKKGVEPSAMAAKIYDIVSNMVGEDPKFIPNSSYEISIGDKFKATFKYTSGYMQDPDWKCYGQIYINDALPNKKDLRSAIHGMEASIYESKKQIMDTLKKLEEEVIKEYSYGGQQQQFPAYIPPPVDRVNAKSENPAKQFEDNLIELIKQAKKMGAERMDLIRVFDKCVYKI